MHPAPQGLPPSLAAPQPPGQSPSSGNSSAEPWHLRDIRCQSLMAASAPGMPCAKLHQLNVSCGPSLPAAFALVRQCDVSYFEPFPPAPSSHCIHGRPV